jgi:DNA modification methylase
LLVISDDQSIYNHGIHSYPAKFIPELPRWAIRKHSDEGDLILDPFAGSGTTNLEALLHNRDSAAIDVDPLALKINKAKNNTYDLKRLRNEKNKLIKRISSRDPSSAELMQFKRRDHWFKKEVSEKMSMIREEIEKVDDDGIRRLFMLTMSAIVRDVSNADPGSHKPCVRKGMDRDIPEVVSKFTKELEGNVKSAVNTSKKLRNVDSTHTIVGENAQKIKMQENSVDMSVTSPPYINAVDYARTHKLEYYWLGIADGSVNDLKKKFTGTEKVYADTYKSVNKTGISELDSIIESIFEEDKKRSAIVWKYFEEMRDHFSEMNRVLKEEGIYAMVVGNNNIRGHNIHNWKYLQEIAEDEGFELQNKFTSGIINHYIPFDREEKIDKDYILVLRNC